MEYVKCHDELVCAGCNRTESNRFVYNQPWKDDRIHVFECGTCGAVTRVMAKFEAVEEVSAKDRRKLKDRDYGTNWQKGIGNGEGKV
jgi:Zn ribbon nucleic-acid-binding protein